MKNLLVLAGICITIVGCNSIDKKANSSDSTDSLTTTAKDAVMADSSNYTTIQWLDSTYLDLGKLTQGKTVEISFRFKNTGSKNLVIHDVTAPCGCTIPEKPQTPYAPGEEGLIKASFNGSGHGEIRKDVHVTANTSPSQAHTLSFRAEMIK